MVCPPALSRRLHRRDVTVGVMAPQEIFGRADTDKDGFMSVDEYFAIHAEAEQNEPQ